MDDGMCLRYFGDNITAVEILPFGNCNMSIPFFLSVQRIYADTAGNKCSGRVCDPLQRAFNTVKNIIQYAGSQSYRNSAAAGCNFFPGTKSGCLLVYLNCSQIFVKSDYTVFPFR